MISSIWRFLWRRDSESAWILIIDAAEYLDCKDLQRMKDYLESLREYRSMVKKRVVDASST